MAPATRPTHSRPQTTTTHAQAPTTTTTTKDPRPKRPSNNRINKQARSMPSNPRFNVRARQSAQPDGIGIGIGGDANNEIMDSRAREQIISEQISRAYNEMSTDSDRVITQILDDARNKISEAVKHVSVGGEKLLDERLLQRKRHFDELVDEANKAVKKFQMGYEKSFTTIAALTETLDRNQLEMLRTKKSFMKELTELQLAHHRELEDLPHQIEGIATAFRKTVNGVQKNERDAAKMRKQLMSMFSI